jgi:hypothetical protein
MAKVAAKRAESEERTKAAAPRARRKREKTYPPFLPFAFRCDGRVMINVNECKGRSLKGRERFVAVLLRPSEARIAFGRLDDSFSEAVGRIVGSMPKLKRQSAKRGAR